MKAEERIPLLLPVIDRLVVPHAARALVQFPANGAGKF